MLRAKQLLYCGDRELDIVLCKTMTGHYIEITRNENSDIDVINIVFDNDHPIWYMYAKKNDITIALMEIHPDWIYFLFRVKKDGREAEENKAIT